MKTITRLGFFGAISAAVSSLFAQATITACAPVLHRMPKPCEGQCPACGLAHGFVQLSDVEQNQIISTHHWRALMFACTYCRNLFARTIPLEIWEQYKQGEKDRVTEILNQIERTALTTRGGQW